MTTEPQPAKQELDQEAKQKIFAADLSNIIRKVKAGKPLSKNERELIEAEADRNKTKAPGPTAGSALVFDSMKAAAGYTRIPLRILKAAKRDGCPAFRSNRFFLIPFLEWYFLQKRDGAEVIDLETEKARETKARADLLEIERSQALGVLLDPAIVQDRINRAFNIIRQYLQAAEAELPAMVNPQDPNIARIELARWLQKFWPLMRDKQNEQPKQDGRKRR